MFKIKNDNNLKFYHKVSEKGLKSKSISHW